MMRSLLVVIALGVSSVSFAQTTAKGVIKGDDGEPVIGASVIIECSGNDVGIASVFDIAGHSCRIGFVGHSIGRKVPVEIGKTIWKTLKMSGSGGTTNWFPRTIRFMSKIKDTYDFKALVSHYYKFDDLAEAMEMAQNKAVARKVMLTFED
jgi:L-iditol 2-dehydrogenase